MTAPDSLPLHALAEDNLASASPDLLRASAGALGTTRDGCDRNLPPITFLISPAMGFPASGTA